MEGFSKVSGAPPLLIAHCAKSTPHIVKQEGLPFPPCLKPAYFLSPYPIVLPRVRDPSSHSLFAFPTACSLAARQHGSKTNALCEVRAYLCFRTRCASCGY